MSNQDDTQGGDASPDPNRAQELELWDRVLKRWNEHTARQIRMAGAILTVVIALLGWLGVSSIDEMVESTVGKSVEVAVEKETKSMAKVTKQLSDRLADNMATMIVRLATLQQQTDKADSLAAKMEDASSNFDELNDKLNNRIAEAQQANVTFDALQAVLRRRITETEVATKQLEEMKRDLRTKLDGFRATLASSDKELEKSMASLRSIEVKIDQVNRIALETVPTKKRTVTKEVEPLAIAKVNALRLRQVPVPLETDSPTGRDLVLLTYSVVVEPGATARDAEAVLDAIETVTYRLDERWFKSPVTERTNRKDHFQFTVRVWGITKVWVEAKLTGRARPVCWSGLMSLDKPVMLKPLTTCPPS